MSKPISLALVGIGKIARDQHIPSITGNPAFRLDAAVSRHGRVNGIENFEDFDAFLKARPDVTAVSLCTPPRSPFRHGCKGDRRRPRRASGKTTGTPPSAKPRHWPRSLVPPV